MLKDPKGRIVFPGSEGNAFLPAHSTSTHPGLTAFLTGDTCSPSPGHWKQGPAAQRIDGKQNAQLRLFLNSRTEALKTTCLRTENWRFPANR